MEILLLIVLVLGFAINIIFMRFFFKRISDKLFFFSPQEQDSPPGVPTPGYIPQDSASKQLFDQPYPNQVGEDDSALELSEQNLSSLPKDVKFEVEGGDTQTPPEFNEMRK